jgi:transposase
VPLGLAGAARRFASTRTGRSRLIAWLTPVTISRIVFEPTGPYHHAFERQLAEAGLPLAKINPRHARRFAEAVGHHAKTDAIDAAMLARLVALLEPPVRPAISQVLDDMKELIVQRLGQIERQITALDTALQAMLATDPVLMARFDILVSIPGVGGTTALILLVELPELGTLDQRRVASLAGLAPLARDSGQYRGKRFIRGGRACLRHLRDARTWSAKPA